MKTKHTPGAWRVTDTGNAIVIIAPNHTARQYVADITRAASQAWFGEQEQANAALIAAAPDCYGVLKELLDLVGIDFARVEITGVIGTTWYERAKAAIAKAEGHHE